MKVGELMKHLQKYHEEEEVVLLTKNDFSRIFSVARHKPNYQSAILIFGKNPVCLEFDKK